MSEAATFRIHVQELDGEKVELVLKSAEPAEIWSKIYDGSLFLSMDAQSLNLLEEVALRPNNGPKYRLRESGSVDIEQLKRMRFVRPEEAQFLSNDYKSNETAVQENHKLDALARAYGVQWP